VAAVAPVNPLLAILIGFSEIAAELQAGHGVSDVPQHIGQSFHLLV
jgi:hypothetical protein